ncbi:MAG: NAD(P)H-dependent oxidoreductase [Deltaproteobacteria bacterium]|nr:NAD(P)H-dependent oxidoreductase [Deltaproteobacteria bacterium]
MKFLGLNGSLRADSTNRQLLLAAIAMCPPGHEIEVFENLGGLPHFNPDDSIDSSAELARFVREVRSSDGIIISSPVYARGYPGTLKNALDWLVGVDAFVDKPFMMLSASNRMPEIELTLVTVLETMSGFHVDKASIAVPLLGTRLSADEITANSEWATSIRGALQRFAETVSARQTPPLD